MGVQVDENAIKSGIAARINKDFGIAQGRIQVDDLTPTGRPRSAPIYYVTVMNTTLGQSRTFKEKSTAALMLKVKGQLETWADQELRTLVSQAKRDAKESAHISVSRGLALPIVLSHRRRSRSSPTHTSLSSVVTLTAVFEKSPDGYAALVEELPGADTQGRTLGQSG